LPPDPRTSVSVTGRRADRGSLVISSAVTDFSALGEMPAGVSIALDFGAFTVVVAKEIAWATRSLRSGSAPQACSARSSPMTSSTSRLAYLPKPAEWVKSSRAHCRACRSTSLVKISSTEVDVSRLCRSPGMPYLVWLPGSSGPGMRSNRNYFCAVMGLVWCGNRLSIGGSATGAGQIFREAVVIWSRLVV